MAFGYLRERPILADFPHLTASEPRERMTRPAVWVLLVAVSLTEVSAAEPVDFVRDVKPLLARHCTKCHGAEEREAGLRLDIGGSILRGSSAGEVVIPGKAAQSRLLQVVRGEDEDVGRMPPEGPGLGAHEIQILQDWIESGAKFPASDVEAAVETDHWAYDAPDRPTLPASSVSDAWVRGAVDAFVLDQLQTRELTPSSEAPRATLIRRLSLDLTGLPPSLSETEAFVNDQRPDAYERLVDRLLASPAYGERWGRHWLDLARYADSNGFTRDFARQIWKYRDWVIEAINSGMSFDEFTVEQIAGDMLPEPSLAQLIATGFHRNTLINEEGGTDPEQFRVDAVADRVSTTGVVFLGVTLGCARCHDHKYDPISQRDYYQMFALLNNCDEPQIDAPSEWQVETGLLARRDALREEIKSKETQLAAQHEEILQAQLAWEETVTPEFRSTLPGPTQGALDTAPEKRDDAQKKLVLELFKKQEVANDAFPLVREIEGLRKTEPAIPTTMIMRERSDPRTTYIHRRGNFLDRGSDVKPGPPSILHEMQSDGGDPDRLDLARWLVAPENPLTARVTVNRYWQRFFGRGIVETENDFGTQGIPPTHPRLLDWLAVEFIESGWSVKRLHRRIVTSAVYRQASYHRADLAEADPANRWLGRQTRLRLEAETIRDSGLAACGLLTHKVGGPSVYPPQPMGVFAFTQDKKPWETASGEDRFRRGMYTYLWRSSPFPALTLFDAPDGNVTCTRRVRSNTPLQSLTLANGQQFVECAQALARELVETPVSTEADRVELAFRRCLVRAPTLAERERILQLLQQQRAAFAADPAAAEALAGDGEQTVEVAAWTATARVLMNLDEFITRE